MQSHFLLKTLAHFLAVLYKHCRAVNKLSLLLSQCQSLTMHYNYLSLGVEIARVGDMLSSLHFNSSSISFWCLSPISASESSVSSCLPFCLPMLLPALLLLSPSDTAEQFPSLKSHTGSVFPEIRSPSWASQAQTLTLILSVCLCVSHKASVLVSSEHLRSLCL